MSFFNPDLFTQAQEQLNSQKEHQKWLDSLSPAERSKQLEKEKLAQKEEEVSPFSSELKESS